MTRTRAHAAQSTLVVWDRDPDARVRERLDEDRAETRRRGCAPSTGAAPGDAPPHCVADVRGPHRRLCTPQRARSHHVHHGSCFAAQRASVAVPWGRDRRSCSRLGVSHESCQEARRAPVSSVHSGVKRASVGHTACRVQREGGAGPLMSRGLHWSAIEFRSAAAVSAGQQGFSQGFSRLSATFQPTPVPRVHAPMLTLISSTVTPRVTPR